MSQERRRRRAQKRTEGRHHVSHGSSAASGAPGSGTARRHPARPGRTALQQRKHNLIVLLSIVVVAVNVLAFFVTADWNHRLLVLVLSIVGATVVYFLAANPAKSTGL
jgi:hypothetical protein